MDESCMKQLNNNNYIAVADWQLELGLNTRELIIYSLIYGFSQDNESFYYGSLDYMAKWLGIKDKNNVIRYLKPMVEKGLLIKKEVMRANGKKSCFYKTAINKGDILSNIENDYIIIQPFMLQDLKLNGKDLLLYALVHGYSRKGSGNTCKLNNSYFAKWLNCRKDHVKRQIEKAKEKGLINEVAKGEFIAITPDNIKPLNANEYQNGEHTQTDTRNTQTDTRNTPKLITNNLYINNLDNNIYVVEEAKENLSVYALAVSRYEEASKEEHERIKEAFINEPEEANKIINEELELISTVFNNYGESKINKIAKLSFKELLNIHNTANYLLGGFNTESIRSPKAILASQINKSLKTICA